MFIETCRPMCTHRCRVVCRQRGRQHHGPMTCGEGQWATMSKARRMMATITFKSWWSSSSSCGCRDARPGRHSTRPLPPRYGVERDG